MENLLLRRLVVVCLIWATLLGGANPYTTQASGGFYSSIQRMPFRAGVRSAAGVEGLNARERQQVLQSLREKTGWQELDFDAAGFLVCPTPQVFSGGSAAARQLLGAALWGADIYELEAHRASKAVNFARLEAQVACLLPCNETAINRQIVQLDFSDFQQLQGDKLARETFDVGIAILHELAHGVWRLSDATRVDEEPGECETFINQIRRELHLPERLHYHVRVGSTRYTASRGTRLIAELHFSRASETTGRMSKRRYRLLWDAEAIGPVQRWGQTSEAKLTTVVR